MFKNRNRKIVNKVVQKIISTQRLKNIFIIMAIVISAVLFTSSATLIGGIIKSQTLMMQMQVGNKADAEAKAMTKEQYSQFIKAPFIQEVGLRRSITFLSNTQHHNIELDYLDEIAQEMLFSKPTHGRAPEKSNEIATSDRALKDLGVKPKVGEKVKISYRLEDGQEYSYEMIVSGWWESINEQTSFMLVSKEYMDQHDEVFERTRKLDFELGRYSAEVFLKNKQNMQEKLEEEVLKLGGQFDDEFAENYTPIVINDTSAEPNILAAIFLILLFLLCSYLLIYNIFDIAVVKDIKSYGLLSTIGTTPSQIRKIVIRQALYLSLIGIPIGLFLGYVMGNKLLPVVLGGLATSGYSHTPIETTANPLLFLFSAVMTFVTIFISIYKPAKLASKYNAIEAAKYSECNQTKKIKIIGSKTCQIAYLNFVRNRKRTILIVISLAICIILFNSVFLVSSSVDIQKYTKAHMKTDYLAANAAAFSITRGYVYRSDGLTEDFVKFIEKMSGIEKIGYLYKNTKEDSNVSFDYGLLKFDSIESFVDMKGDMNKYGLFEIGGRICGAFLSIDGRPRCNVYGTDRATAERFQFGDRLDGMSDAEIINKLFSGNYIIEAAIVDSRNPTIVEEVPGYQCKLGQKVTAYKNGEGYKTYTVIAQIAVINAEVESSVGYGGATEVGMDASKFYLPNSEFKKLYDSPTLLNITFNTKNASEKEKINIELNKYMEENPLIGYSSSEEVFRRINEEKQKLSVVGGIMAGILGVVGVINFINLIVTSVITRKNDFAIMECVGMTQKQLKRMIILESVFYGVATGILGLLVSYGISASIIKKILSQTWYYTFQMSLIPGLFIWIILFLIMVISSWFAMSLFNKGELTEKLPTGG